MNEDLAVENPEDLKRRLIQKAVLDQEPVLLSSGIDIGADEDRSIDEEEYGEEGRIKVISSIACCSVSLHICLCDEECQHQSSIHNYILFVFPKEHVPLQMAERS